VPADFCLDFQEIGPRALMGLGPGSHKPMAGAYVAEALQWRGDCLDYMNSRFGARLTFEKLALKTAKNGGRRTQPSLH
jgi:hypothetical protein